MKVKFKTIDRAKAEKSAKHTPVPWRVDWSQPCVVIAKTDLSHGLGDAGITDKANAAFIVQACNSHDELLCMLRRLLDEVCMTEQGMKLIAPLTLEQARAAIAKAERGDDTAAQ